MKYIVLVVVLLASCSPKIPISHNTDTRFYYVLMKPSDIYDKPDFSARRLPPLYKGDTISTLNTQIEIDGWNAVELKQHLVYVRVPSVYALPSIKSKRMSHKEIQYLSNNLLPTYTGASVSSGADEMTSTPTTGATIHTGSRGGRYYYNSKGNKTYIKRK